MWARGRPGGWFAAGAVAVCLAFVVVSSVLAGLELGRELPELAFAGGELLLPDGERGDGALQLCVVGAWRQLALHGREQVPLGPVQPQPPAEPALPLAELAPLALELALALLDRAGALA